MDGNSRRGGLPRMTGPVVLGGVLLLFLALASRMPSLPGPHYDELYNVSQATEFVLGLPLTTPWSVSFGGRDWPIAMRQPYDINTFIIYVGIGALKVFGVKVAGLRITGVLTAALLLFLFYKLWRLWFSEPVALVSVVLAAASPAVLIWGRTAFFTDLFFSLVFAHLSLLCASLWYKKGDVRMFYAACFLCAFELNISVRGLAHVVAYPVAFFLLVPRSRWPRWGQILRGAGAGVLAAVVPLGLNAAAGWPSAVSLLGGLSSPTVGGVDNWNILNNVAIRCGQFSAVLRGVWPTESIGGTAVPNPVILPVFLAAAAACLLDLFSKRSPPRPILKLVLFLPAGMLFLTGFTPSNLGPIHLMAVWPYPALILGIVLGSLMSGEWTAGRPERWRRMGKIGAAAVFAALLAFEGRVIGDYFRTLSKTGGDGYWSDSVYELARYLDAEKINQPICLTWGIGMNVYFLTEGRVHPIEGHRCRLGGNLTLRDRYVRWVKEPGHHFVSITPDFESQGVTYGYYKLFDDVLAGLGKRKVVVKTIKTRRGQDWFFVCRVEDEPPPARSRGTRGANE
ncbi:MAG TPA: glycosyltransferase family 39 protein [Elusimicrobiota bacterium]|nr:glycosyltransferase family 39 protein [Elusimicrobiota bacterium]